MAPAMSRMINIAIYTWRINLDLESICNVCQDVAINGSKVNSECFSDLENLEILSELLLGLQLVLLLWSLQQKCKLLTLHHNASA